MNLPESIVKIILEEDYYRCIKELNEDLLDNYLELFKYDLRDYSNLLKVKDILEYQKKYETVKSYSKGLRF